MKIFLKLSPLRKSLPHGPAQYSRISANNVATSVKCSVSQNHLLKVKYQITCFVTLKNDFSKNFSSYIIPKKNVDLEAGEENVGTVNKLRLDIGSLFEEIRTELSSHKSAGNIAVYSFDGKGKSLRPLIVLLMAKAVNFHQGNESKIHTSQRELAKIVEMIHTSSLLHDDVVDGANTRRGKPAVHSLFSHKKAVFVGDFILSMATAMLGRIGNVQVTRLISQIFVELVQGEFMQLNTSDKEDEMFVDYLAKTYNKTASLIAVSCRATAVLAGANEDVQEICFQYGKHCGIAFQLIDDMLDFTCTTSTLGKPNLSDLNSGLATAPVLFACEKFPELYQLIKRQFQEPQDVNKALNFVLESDGIDKTKFLAYKHCQEAIMQINLLKQSPEQKSLILLTDEIINRKK